MVRVIKTLFSALIGLTLGYSLVTLLLFIMIPTNYIANINFKTHSNKEIHDIFDQFNYYANYPVIRYIPGFRRIYITENDKTLNMLSPPTKDKFALGVTQPGPLICSVYIKENLPHDTLRHVLLHEVVGHCFGYDHVDKENDLLSAFNSDNITEDNIKEWAERVKERILTWKIF